MRPDTLSPILLIVLLAAACASPDSGSDSSSDPSSDHGGEAPDDPRRGPYEPALTRLLVAPHPDADGPDAFPTLDARGEPWLAGDLPLPGGGDGLHWSLSGTEIVQAEVRELPVPTGISGPGPVDADYFGSGDQVFLRAEASITLELSQHEPSVDANGWRVRLTPVLGMTRTELEEVGVLAPSVSDDDVREDDEITLQEAFFEDHFLELEPGGETLSAQLGILPYRSDFRGFVFSDTNLGARFSGSLQQHRWEYDLVFFDMLDKDTNTGLNDLDADRHQEVFIATALRRDWFPFVGEVPGYDTQFSFHYDDDHRDTHFDDNDFLVTPAPIGQVEENEVEAFYLGWAGEGHVGRFDISHALYQVLGTDDENPIAAQEVDLNAQLAALELSWDVGAWRLSTWGLHASGDRDAQDDTAQGYDAIFDAPAFAGGELSFFGAQSLDLLGVNLTSALSPLPDLSSSKTQGHANFVNPGVNMLGAGLGTELGERWSLLGGLSWLAFSATDSLETVLQLSDVDSAIGTEGFLALRWRPSFGRETLVQLGLSGLLPGAGLERIYQSDDLLWAAAAGLSFSW